MSSTILLVLVLLQLKHLVVDWIMQPPWMWRNKGTYGHPGGFAHAYLNALGTALCFILAAHNEGRIFLVLVIDFLVHYHVDWAKVTLVKKYKWGPMTHPQFWWLTGLDQFLHQITYLLLFLVL